jgi:hypothetical protein
MGMKMQMELEMEMEMEGWIGEAKSFGSEPLYPALTLPEAGSDGLPKKEFHCECSDGFPTHLADHRQDI